MYYQQGDVIIERVEEIKGKKVNHLILADGEATGHAHRVGVKELDQAEIYEDNGTLYLKTLTEVPITHEEHKTITVPPGTWRIRKVMEYDHFEEEAREVID